MKRPLALADDLVQSNEKSARRRADDTDASSSAAASAGSDNYDVFLSFSGKDTRKTLADHLYNGLVSAGIRVFRDDDELREGENIGINLLQAIKNSKISIPILSLNYASSKWCLQELVQMTECMKSDEHVVLPIFYRVKPAHVRYQVESFGVEFSHLSEKYVQEDVAKWKQALQEVASLKGWESEITADGREGELVKMVVKKVWSQLKKAFQLVVTEQLVGIDNTVKDILRLLGDKPNTSQIVGIYGIGGIGKTTLAKVVYNSLLDQFLDHSFIEDIRESSKRNGILCLQNQLISNILGDCNRASNRDVGIQIMKSSFKNKKVLILLDDVDHIDQLKALVGKHDWFGMGSRIIITTRNSFILDEAGVKCQYELKEIAKDESLILFSRHAFMRDSPPDEFKSLSCDVVSTTGGLPLALEVIGSSLRRRNRPFWQDALKKLKKVPHDEVQAKLKISYDILNEDEKQIFLDIVCFFIGYDLRMASYMWDACGFSPNMSIEKLSSLSLIKIGNFGRVKMHDQLRDLGRAIVHQEDCNSVMNRSRPWVPEEALEVLQGNKGIRKDRVLALCLHKRRYFDDGEAPFDFDYDFGDDDGEASDFDDGEGPAFDDREPLTAEKFEALSSLRLLVVNNAKLIGDSKTLLPELRWLSWKGNPAFVATSFDLKKLVVLNLSESNISEHWEGWSHLKVAKQLKVLNLSYCRGLKITPNLSAFRNLEMLILEGCSSLEQIHPSIGEAKGLTVLDLSLCYKLQELPQEIGKLGNLEELDGLSSLKILNLSWTCISGFSEAFDKFSHLETLELRSCPELQSLPQSIRLLPSLQHLDLSCSSRLQSLPELPVCLTELHITSQCCTLPQLSHLSHLKVLSVMGCQLLESMPELPSGLSDLYVIECEKLKELPNLVSLESLSTLYLDSCGELTEIKCLGALKSLANLKARNCGKLSNLDGLEPLLKNLELLDICGCTSIETLPDLSCCKKLTWLVTSGCPKLRNVRVPKKVFTWWKSP